MLFLDCLDDARDPIAVFLHDFNHHAKLNVFSFFNIFVKFINALHLLDQLVLNELSLVVVKV